MEKSHKIIIVGLIIVIIALVAVLAVMIQGPAKDNVKLTIENKKTIEEGGKVKIRLTDMNGTPIKGQTVNISITDKKGTTDYHSVVTNEKGVGKLKLDKGPGKYTVNCTYGGNENYTGNSTTQKLKIKEKVVETEKIDSTSTSEYSSDASNDNSNDVKLEGGGQEIVDDDGNRYKVHDMDPGYEIIREDGSYVWTDYDGNVIYSGEMDDYNIDDDNNPN